jgi:hypothetical protein
MSGEGGATTTVVVDVVEGTVVEVVAGIDGSVVVVVDVATCASARSVVEVKSTAAIDPASAILETRPHGRSR